MKRAEHDYQDVYLSILPHRNTPMQGYDNSPAQKFLGRRTKTTLPTRYKLLNPETINPVTQKEKTDAQRTKPHHYKD